MSDQGSGSESHKDVALSPAASTAEPQTAVSKVLLENNSVEEINKMTDEEKEDDDDDDDDVKDEEEEEEEEEMCRSAHLEPSTLPWSGDKKLQTVNTPRVWAEEFASEPDERDAGISGRSQDLSEEQSHTDSDRKSKSRWRESMPEGERWRDEEVEVQQDHKRDNSATDEEEKERDTNWISEKGTLGFTPQVTIVHPCSKELPVESLHFTDKDAMREQQMEPDSAVQFYSEWEEQDDKYYLCQDLCSEKLRVALALVAAAVLFPLLVWGGYALLPFDPPQLDSPPLRLVYTLRCAFFATIPIMLGVLVQGVARLRYSTVTPLYRSKLVDKHVSVHHHYVNESLGLFLFFFLQLAVMATYISQDLVKLVPLLTIIFVFGRLIYWLCLALDSSIRGLGFGFSFFPILVMLGVNLYFVCSSVGEGSVFDVAPPTTPPPPPKQRWWG